jgi:hypothetical protein
MAANLMTHKVISREIEPTAVRRAPSRSRIVLVAIVLLAALGTVVATWTVLGTRKGSEPGVGDPVDTEFGSFTVTRVSKTFVPDTQGPPSAAQHAGTNGSDQLQVWVNVRNTDDRTGVTFAPGQFSLVSETGRPKQQEAAGSTLGEAFLQQGGSIDGQVWFDPPKASGGQRWLVFAPPGGDTVRVSLGDVDLGKAPKDDEHSGDDQHR